MPRTRTALVSLFSPFSLFTMLTASAPRAEVRRVPSAYPTIQAAIDAATAGDVVLVAPGSYSGAGNVDLDFHGVDLVCRSEEGARSTTLQVGPPVGQRAFHLHGGETRGAIIEGFTILGGVAADGGAIACRNASPTIRDCVIDQCRAGRGGGLFLEASSALVERVTVTRCRANYDGAPDDNGAALFLLDSDAEFEDCAFAGNFASGFPHTPAAVFLRGGGTLRRCVASGNEGIGISADRAHLDHCVVAFNDKQEIDVVTTVEIEGTIIRDTCDANDLFLQPGSMATISCSMLQPSKVDGAGAVRYVTSPITSNPNFCDIPNCPSIPSVDGFFAVGSDSPARPENNPCGDFLGAIYSNSCDPAAVATRPRDDAPRLVEVGPNPTRGGIEVGFWLPRPAAVTLTLVDPAGRRLAVLANEEWPAGLNRWRGRVHGKETPALPAGVYAVVLESADAQSTTNVVLLPAASE
ncbi:MAG: right-handed parallel beta-helix repeat-containing protein [Candidatus Eisenbacteria bacterium]